MRFNLGSVGDDSDVNQCNSFESSKLVLTPVRATKNQSLSMGSSVVVTPVRRSTRTPVAEMAPTTTTVNASGTGSSVKTNTECVKEILKETNFAFAPNPSLNMPTAEELEPVANENAEDEVTRRDEIDAADDIVAENEVEIPSACDEGVASSPVVKEAPPKRVMRARTTRAGASKLADAPVEAPAPRATRSSARTRTTKAAESSVPKKKSVEKEAPAASVRRSSRLRDKQAKH